MKHLYSLSLFFLSLGLGSKALATQANPSWASFESLDDNLDSDNSGLLWRWPSLGVRLNAQSFRAKDPELYLVNLHQSAFEARELFDFGQLHDLQEGYGLMSLSEEGMLRLSSELHAQKGSCGQVIRLDPRFASKSPRTHQTRVKPLYPTDQAIPALTRLMESFDEGKIKLTVDAMAAMPTRFHKSASGKEVAQFLTRHYQNLVRTPRRGLSVETFSHGDLTHQDSLIVRIPGSERPDEIIILGSHIDTITYWGTRSPGADDNASGTATNLEIFRLISEFGLDFSRTIEIHGYAAEEIGLVGSQDIARTYKEEGKNVVAMLQFDMNLYRAGDQDQIFLITSDTHPDLNRGLKNIAELYTGVPVSLASLSGGTSDHASWDQYGFPAAFPFENPSDYNQHIHSSGDTVEHAHAFSQSVAFAKLGLAFLGHYAGLKD